MASTKDDGKDVVRSALCSENTRGIQKEELEIG
jgi:hypothetical protein